MGGPGMMGGGPGDLQERLSTLQSLIEQMDKRLDLLQSMVAPKKAETEAQPASSPRSNASMGTCGAARTYLSLMRIIDGWLLDARRVESPNCDTRPRAPT